MDKKSYNKGIKEERKRCIKIVKSHIEPTYPHNCKAICREIKKGD